MRVVSFNIHHGTVAKRGPVDARQLGEVCAAFDADVIALQEVDQCTERVGGVDLAAVVAAACGMEHAFGASQLLPGGRYGNAVLVRGSIHTREVTQLPKVPRSQFWQEQRTVLEVGATVDDLRLQIAATHLAVKQWNNGPQLEFLRDHLRRSPRPLVVLGDFNRRAAGLADFEDETGLHRAEHGPTYPAWEPVRDIDHVLVSSDLEVTAAEVVPTPMSDHAALVVELRVRRG